MLEHFNMNYGERLIIWDFLFGTMVKDFNCYPPTGVNGIERWVVESDSTMRALIIYWFKQTFYPFYKIGQSIGQEAARVIGSAKEKRTFRAVPPAQDAAVEVVLPTPVPAAQIGVAITQ